MKNFIKKEKGITLIALVITIIVLLILAGVAISMLAGENGIINKVNSAKTESKEAEKDEADKLLDYEEAIDKHGYGNVKAEYLEGTNLRLNVPYYLSGIKDSYKYFVAYADGKAVYVENKVEMPITYTIEEGIITVNETGWVISIIKEDNNDIAISEHADELFATSTNGVRFFNGEEYIYENGTTTYKITLGQNESKWEQFDNYGVRGSYSTSPHTPIFYNGRFFDIFNSELTSTDNCETLIYEGNTYTKVTE